MCFLLSDFASLALILEPALHVRSLSSRLVVAWLFLLGLFFSSWVNFFSNTRWEGSVRTVGSKSFGRVVVLGGVRRQYGCPSQLLHA